MNVKKGQVPGQDQVGDEKEPRHVIASFQWHGTASVIDHVNQEQQADEDQRSHGLQHQQIDIVILVVALWGTEIH